MVQVAHFHHHKVGGVGGGFNLVFFVGIALLNAVKPLLDLFEFRASLIKNDN
jgi:hypothetical protein